MPAVKQFVSLKIHFQPFIPSSHRAAILIQTIAMSAFGCAFPSLQGAFRNDQTIFIAKILKVTKSKGISIVYLQDVRSFNGELFEVDSIKVNSYNGNLTKYDEIIFSPIAACNNYQLELYFDWAEIWRVKNGIVIDGVSPENKKMPIKEIIKNIEQWKKMGACVKC